MSDTFQSPRITINRVYTRKGDGGETGLVGGQRVPKDHLRIEGYGTVDELNSVVGLCRCTLAEAAPAVSDEGRREALGGLDRALLRVQHALFNLGSLLATLPADVHPRQPRVGAADVAWLEEAMDAANEGLPTLRSFVLPGGHRLNAELHLARTVCRRAERLVVGLSRHEEVDPLAITYLNRLSDALFVWSRYASAQLGVAEVLWEPNAAL